MEQEEARKRHNALAPVIVKAICGPVTKDKETIPDVLLLLESVIAGAVIFLAAPGHDEAVIDTIIDGVRERVAELRKNELH